MELTLTINLDKRHQERPKFRRLKAGKPYILKSRFLFFSYLRSLVGPQFITVHVLALVHTVPFSPLSALELYYS